MKGVAIRIIILIAFLAGISAELFSQKKPKRDKFAEGRPKVFETLGDSLRTDSVVYYETEIGYVMPDHSKRFIGDWEIVVMRRQARAVPDSLQGAWFRFIDDSSLLAFTGCDTMKAKYIIKGPTIKFHADEADSSACPGEIVSWFRRLLEERVSYFGIDEQTLYLKDVAYNIVFDCRRRKPR